MCKHIPFDFGGELSSERMRGQFLRRKKKYHADVHDQLKKTSTDVVARRSKRGNLETNHDRKETKQRKAL